MIKRVKFILLTYVKRVNMLTNFLYPRCANTFRKWLSSNSKYDRIYNELGTPVPFDVSLRDGLQALPKEIQKDFTTNDKLKIYHNISFNYKPLNIEIGSIVSEKVLPIFADTMEMMNVLLHNSKTTDSLDESNKYLLVPNKAKLQNIINNPHINNFSFISSVSNSFQIKNTRMTLDESDREIQSMIEELNNNTYRKVAPVIKLYVSCISECPMEGKIDCDFIINRLVKLNTWKVDSICLSDTCGTLQVEEFENIINSCILFELIHPSKISLHLHVKDGRADEVEKIIHKALEYKIINFDVSSLNTGGCSVTMNRQRLLPNLSYDLYYKSLCNYILSKA